jgi:hypothetical protein
LPAAVEATLETVPVARFLTWMGALPMTAPDGSMMVPVMVAVACWAELGATKARESRRRHNISLRIFIDIENPCRLVSQPAR